MEFYRSGEGLFLYKKVLGNNWMTPPNCIVLSPASIISNAKTVNPAKLFAMVSNNY